jgi:hypothetical protein
LLAGWESLGQCRRLGKKARWVVRSGLDNHQEYVPVASVPGLGGGPQVPEVDESDLLG